MTAVSIAPRLGTCVVCGELWEHPGRRGHIPVRCPRHRAEWEQARWKRVPKEKRARAMRKAHLKFKYGLTHDDVVALWDLQGQSCAVCWRPITVPPLEGGGGSHMKYAAVDHDHATGEVRGLLCFQCNTGLGSFRDRPDVLREAAAYVEGVV